MELDYSSSSQAIQTLSHKIKQFDGAQDEITDIKNSQSFLDSQTEYFKIP
jgi:hypothetical protein